MTVHGLDPDVMTVAEVAAKLRLSERCIYAQVKAGTFPVKPVPIGARKLLFSTKRIRALIDGEPDTAVAS